MIRVFQASGGQQTADEEQQTFSKRQRSRKAGSLYNMSDILNKNKEKALDKKMMKLRAIQARKLRIKIREIFHPQILKSLQTNPQPLSKVREKGTSKLGRTVSLPGKVNEKSYQMNIVKGKKMNDSEKAENLFSKFSLEQLEEIQADLLYYLETVDLIDLFKRFIYHKRLKTKDRSYQNFMIKVPSTSLNQVETLDTESARNVLFEKLGIRTHADKNRGLHLLTNPLQGMKSKSIKAFHPFHQSANVMGQLREMQQKNMQRLRTMSEKKRIELRLDKDYLFGIVHENRASMRDEKHRETNSRNHERDLKSQQYRSRLKMLSQTFGKSVQMAEAMRAIFLRNVKKNKLSLDPGQSRFL